MASHEEPATQAELSKKAARLKNIPRLNYSIPEASYAAGVCRSVLYPALMSGELASIKIGKRRLIPVDALTRWLDGKKVA